MGPTATQPTAQPTAPSQGGGAIDDATFDSIVQKSGVTPQQSSSGGGGDWYSQLDRNKTPSDSGGTPDKGIGDFLSKSKDLITGAFDSGGKQISQGVSEISKGEDPLSAVESAGKIESGVASAVSSPLAPLFKPVTALMGAASDALSDTPLLKDYGKDTASLPASEQTAPERITSNAANAGNVAGTILGADQAVKGVPEVAKTVQDAYSSAAQGIKDMVSSSPEQLDAKVLDSYNKAVKPTTASKTGPGQLDKYNANVASAVKSIVANKDALSFETDGGTEAGRLPKTRGEFADAVAQAKKSIFTQYDTLAQKAGEKGAAVDMKPVAGSLDPIIKSEALQISNPNAVEYAKSIQSRLFNEDGTSKSIDAKTAQDVIANYNSSLKAFYRNPSYETASRAAIDAHVVGQIRDGLDGVIQKATGEDYQGLKDQYGALTAIEKDVNKAAIAESKGTGSNASGLGKYVDIFSGGDVVNGLLSLNPVLFTKGVAQIGFNHLFQWYNSPERAIGNMFDAAQGKSLGNTVAGAIETEPSAGLSMKDVTKNIPQEDLSTMRDFTDYVNGAYKPSESALKQLKLDAQRIADKYNIPSSTGSDKTLSNTFGRVLDAKGFDRKISK